MASILKVDTIQDQDGNNIINESANTITIGASGDTITIPSGATFASVGIDDNATSTAITIDSSENVGIGTSSPSEKLEVSDGKLLIKTTSGAAFLEIVSPGGTADSVINFGDSADNNVGAISYEHDNNAMNFRVNASTAMRIDSSGNVGIGTSSPDFPLEIYKASTSEVAIGSDNGGTAQLSFYENNSTAKEFFVKYDGLNNNGVIGTSAVSNAIVIPRDSGNVGIGTSSPDVKLQVQGASALGSGTGTTNAIRIHDTSAGSSWSTTQDFNQLQFSSGDTSNPAGSGVRYSIGVVAHDSANTYSNLTFRNYDGTEHMRINGAYGSVGIGTDSPDSKVNIEATKTTALSTANDFLTTGLTIDDTTAYNTSGGVGGGITFRGKRNSSGVQTVYGAIVGTKNGTTNDEYNGNLRFFTNNNSNGIPTEHMRITSLGRVGIGTTSPTDTVSIGSFDANGASTGINLGSGSLIQTSISSTSSLSHVRFKNPNGQVGQITTSGSSTTYSTSSDYRLKENVNYDFDATSRLKQLKPARFNFIADADTTVDGFLAHEVQDVVPEAITGTKDAVQVWKEGEELPEGVSVGDNKLDENGNTIPEYQGIDQAKLVPLLVKTIQELEARITQLENA